MQKTCENHPVPFITRGNNPGFCHSLFRRRVRIVFLPRYPLADGGSTVSNFCVALWLAPKDETGVGNVEEEYTENHHAGFATHMSARVLLRGCLQEASRNGANVHRLESHKQRLVANQRTIVPIAQLLNPISTSHQYQHDGQKQKSQKHLQPRVQRPQRMAQVAHHVVGKQDDEDAESDNLQDETAHGDAHTDLVARLGLRSR